MEFILFMSIFPSWVSWKGKEAILDEVRGWGVSGIHKSERVVHGLAVGIEGHRQGCVSVGEIDD